jgi:pilus assembly protein Flp/PilA
MFGEPQMELRWRCDCAFWSNIGVSVMTKLISHFLNDVTGATAIEYGLIAAGIAVVIITAVQTAGTNLNTTFTTIAGAL